MLIFSIFGCGTVHKGQLFSVEESFHNSYQQPLENWKPHVSILISYEPLEDFIKEQFKKEIQSLPFPVSLDDVKLKKRGKNLNLEIYFDIEVLTLGSKGADIFDKVLDKIGLGQSKVGQVERKIPIMMALDVEFVIDDEDSYNLEVKGISTIKVVNKNIPLPREIEQKLLDTFNDNLRAKFILISKEHDLDFLAAYRINTTNHGIELQGAFSNKNMEVIHDLQQNTPLSEDWRIMIPKTNLITLGQEKGLQKVGRCSSQFIPHDIRLEKELQFTVNTHIWNVPCIFKGTEVDFLISWSHEQDSSIPIQIEKMSTEKKSIVSLYLQLLSNRIDKVIYKKLNDVFLGFQDVVDLLQVQSMDFNDNIFVIEGKLDDDQISSKINTNLDKDTQDIPQETDKNSGNKDSKKEKSKKEKSKKEKTKKEKAKKEKTKKEKSEKEDN